MHLVKTKFFNLILGLAFLVTMSACKTVNPETGQAEFDPVRTESVKAAIEPVITGTIRRVLNRNPKHAVEIANYIREGGKVFCEMDATGKFDPLFLAGRLDALFVPQIGADLELLLTLKDSAIALYKINYAQRLTAELPPEEWPRQVANLFCNGIDRGLKSAGQPGVL